MNKIDELLKLATLYERKASIAITLDSLKKTIKDTLETLWEQNPSIMDGFVYVSEVNYSAVMGVSFTLNLDKGKANIVAANKTKRDALINNALKKELKQAFNQDINVGYSEVLV